MLPLDVIERGDGCINIIITPFTGSEFEDRARNGIAEA
jgi:hypothetical protein